VWPRAVRKMCWAHVYRNIQKELPAGDNSTALKDIKLLQLAKSEAEFMEAAEMIGQNWPAEFREYFFKSWIHSDLFRWYEGVSRTLSTNNGLESCNKYIKKTHMEYKRYPLGPFVAKAMDIVNHWSVTKAVG
jgi:transposase-like protein